MRFKTVAALAAVALALTACGSDEDTTDTTDDTPTEAAPTEDDVATDDAMAPEELAVTGQDYSFTGIPAEIAVGTTITFSNSSEAEVHEIVAVNVGADTAPLADILAGMQAAMESGDSAGIDVALVAVAAPGETGQLFVGDGTLAEPGRYVFLCAIQQGVAPADYFAEAQRMAEAGEEGPVNIEGGGQPHALLGMVAEAQVS